MSATFVEAFRQSGSDPIDSDWLGWLRRELAPTSARKIRTAIIVAGAVLCVIISMALQVPELATSAYMVFFISKESKLLTTITGVGGVFVLTIGIGATLILYKFTYGHPELRIPGMAIALFLGMWLSRVLVIGPLGFLLGFVVAVSQSVGEEIPSPELLVRGLLWLWVALAYAIALTVVLNLLFLPDTPHMETIASLVFLVACAAAIAGWVAAGSERISYAGLQIAFAFFYSVFQGYAPDTDLDNVRNRVAGILLGLIVTGLAFNYIWPERTIDRLRSAFRLTLRQLAQLLEIPRPQASIEAAKTESQALIEETAKSFEQARRYAELTQFEFEESPDREQTSLGNLESTLSRAEEVFGVATLLGSERARDEWQQLSSNAQMTESELRNVAAKRVERAAAPNKPRDGADLALAFDRWNQAVAQLP